MVKKTLTSKLETGLQDAISIEQISTGSYQVTDMNGNKHLFKPRLKPGEYIAIAMNYEQIWKQSNDPDRFLQIIANKHQVEKNKIMLLPGWKNKMFVKAELMPYKQRILSVKIKRLQDLTEQMCVREGVERKRLQNGKTGFGIHDKQKKNG